MPAILRLVFVGNYIGRCTLEAQHAVDALTYFIREKRRSPHERRRVQLFEVLQSAERRLNAADYLNVPMSQQKIATWLSNLSNFLATIEVRDPTFLNNKEGAQEYLLLQRSTAAAVRRAQDGLAKRRNAWALLAFALSLSTLQILLVALDSSLQ